MITITDEALDHLAMELGDRLKKSEKVLSCAESCTGGFISKVVTDVAGCSSWFDRGFVTYTNQSKTELLGVPAEIISGHGAVSVDTARAMASGALAHSQASISVAVTGLAGPGGGSLDKPVGTVCFAWARRDGLQDVDVQHFKGDRDGIRRQTVAYALQGILARIG